MTDTACRNVVVSETITVIFHDFPHAFYLRDMNLKIQKIEQLDIQRQSRPKVDPNVAYIAYSSGGMIWNQIRLMKNLYIIF